MDAELREKETVSAASVRRGCELEGYEQDWTDEQDRKMKLGRRVAYTQSQPGAKL